MDNFYGKLNPTYAIELLHDFLVSHTITRFYSIGSPKSISRFITATFPLLPGYEKRAITRSWRFYPSENCDVRWNVAWEKIIIILTLPNLSLYLIRICFLLHVMLQWLFPWSKLDWRCLFTLEKKILPRKFFLPVGCRWVH